MALARALRPLTKDEEDAIVRALRDGASPADIAYGLRVPELWIERIDRALDNAARAAQTRAKQAALAARIRDDAERRARQLAHAPKAQKPQTIAELCRPPAIVPSGALPSHERDFIGGAS